MYINRVKSLLAVATLSLAALSCAKEEVNLQPLAEERYQPVAQPIAYMSNEYGAMATDEILLNEEGKIDMFVNLNTALTTDAALTVEYAPEVLTAYNTANKTEYAALPQELVSFAKDVVISKGARQSEPIALSFRSADNLEAMATYAVPLRVRPVGNELRSVGANAGSKLSDFVLLIKDITKMPNAKKASGMELISCMEVNDANPLNHLCFTLKGTGQPLFNQVILFSGNINYDEKTGRVYNYNNPNVSHILRNREKYLKPLQEKGIKVILGILGNHDRAGVANLSDEGAKLFAQELKRVLNAYELDGVFFDDEYSAYGQYPGFVSPSFTAASRLCYETKKAIGDKLVQVYVYTKTATLYAVDGVQPGNYIDYALHDYGGTHSLENAYPGLPKERWGMRSQEYARGISILNESTLRTMREQGYRTHMVFAMNPFHNSFSWRQKPSMEAIARAFYDDELVYDGKPYSKDW